jgi:hypothetical protein
MYVRAALILRGDQANYVEQLVATYVLTVCLVNL